MQINCMAVCFVVISLTFLVDNIEKLEMLFISKTLPILSVNAVLLNVYNILVAEAGFEPTTFGL